jgi:hypothetical protein
MAEICAEVARYNPLVRLFVFVDLVQKEQSKVFERAAIRRYGIHWQERVPRGRQIVERLRY